MKISLKAKASKMHFLHKYQNNQTIHKSIIKFLRKNRVTSLQSTSIESCQILLDPTATLEIPCAQHKIDDKQVFVEGG